MKKIYKYILIFIMIFLVCLPLIKDNSKAVKIDGVFDEWDYVFSLEYEESFYNYKIDRCVKDIKYFRDDDYLYLYIEKYYYDSIWSIMVNVLEEENNDTYVSNSLVFKEVKENNELKMEFIQSGDWDGSGFKGCIVDNKVELRIPLSVLKKKFDEDNLMFEVLVGEKELNGAQGLSDVDVILNKGSAFEKNQSIIFAVMILLMGLIYIDFGYNKM